MEKKVIKIMQMRKSFLTAYRILNCRPSLGSCCRPRPFPCLPRYSRSHLHPQHHPLHSKGKPQTNKVGKKRSKKKKQDKTFNFNKPGH